MSDMKKWRGEAARLLSAPIERKRDLGSVIGRVDDRFDEILDARRRGMAWAQIAKALENRDVVSVDAVESAYKRVCQERGVEAAIRRGPVQARPSQVPVPRIHQRPGPSEQTNLFGSTQQERWVDDGE